MTDKENFQLGFLQKCATDGLSVDETRQRIAVLHGRLKKQAYAGEAVVKALQSGLGYGTAAALFAPPLLGFGSGALLAKLQTDKYDPHEAQKREVLSEYDRALARLRRARRRAGLPDV